MLKDSNLSPFITLNRSLRPATPFNCVTFYIVSCLSQQIFLTLFEIVSANTYHTLKHLGFYVFILDYRFKLFLYSFDWFVLGTNTILMIFNLNASVLFNLFKLFNFLIVVPPKPPIKEAINGFKVFLFMVWVIS